MGAQGKAAHGPVYTRALVLAVGLEAFSVLVDSGVVFARSSLRLCSADALGGSGTGPEVALQPFGVVTRLAFATVFIELLGAHFAASTTVKNQTNPWGTSGHLQGTLAYSRAG